MYVCIKILIAMVVIISTPFLSFSAELIHTIQIGSHLTEPRAKQQYGSVLDMLKEEERGYLRIEKIGNYYVLRLGGFTTSREAEGLLLTVNTVYPDAIMMTAYISANRLVKMHRPAAVEEPARAMLELKEEPAMVPEEKQAGAQQIEIEEPAPAILELKEAPAMVPEQKQAGAQQINVEEPAPAILELKEAPAMVPEQKQAGAQQINVEEPAPAILKLKEEPAMVPEEKQAGAQQVEVEDSASGTPAEVKTQNTIIDVVSPVKSVVDGDKAGAMVDESHNTISFRQLITIVSALTLIMLVLFVRARNATSRSQSWRAASKDGQGAETAQDSEKLAEEQNDTGKALRGEVPGTAKEDRPLQKDTVGTDKNIEVSVAGKEDSNAGEAVSAVEFVELKAVETSEAGEGISVATVTASTDLQETESSDREEEKPAKEKRENRISNAVEAAMFADKSKRRKRVAD